MVLVLEPTELVSRATEPLGSLTKPDSPSLAVTFMLWVLLSTTGALGQPDVIETVGLALSTFTVSVPAADSLVALSLTVLLAVLVPLVVTLKLAGKEVASTPLPALVSLRAGSPLSATSILTESLYQSTPLTVALRLWPVVANLSVGALGLVLSTLTRSRFSRYALEAGVV